MPDTNKLKRRARLVALIGAILGIACSFAPPKYQAACTLVVQICTR